MTRKLFFLFLLLHGVLGVRAQYFQFSQFNFAPQRINPASVASSNVAQVAFLFRHQTTDGGIFLNTNMLNASYPLIARTGKRWSGVGVSLMHDQAGPAGIFVSQEAALSYALNIPVAKGQTLALGFKALHANRKIDVAGLYTGLQFVPERGFDGSVESGENVNQFNQQFLTFSSGIFWQQEDKNGNLISAFGISFFDFNKPDEALLGSSNPYPSTFVTFFRTSIYQRNKLSLFPEILYTKNAGKGKFNAGLVTSYELKSYRKRPSDRVDILTKYLSGGSAMLGIQLSKEKFSFGASYDFSLSGQNVANTGAVEIGLIWKKLVDPVAKRKARAKNAKQSPVAKKPVQQKPQPQADTTSIRRTADAKPEKTSMSERLRAKQDSIAANAQVGKVEHEAMVLEKANLHFNFGFNSSILDDESQKFLEEVAQALRDNPDLRIQLTGHTDNVGSPKFNITLSKTRAEAIKSFLMEQGVEDERIDADGKGMAEPLNGNATDEERSKNRRVEMKIVYNY
jgi:type IX secretion system PorP/SprF family membrane protein